MSRRQFYSDYPDNQQCHEEPGCQRQLIFEQNHADKNATYCSNARPDWVSNAERQAFGSTRQKIKASNHAKDCCN